MLISIFLRNRYIRFTLTTASLVKDMDRENNEGEQLILQQVAEKDVHNKSNSETIFEVKDGNMVMTITVQSNEGPISGSRYFTRYDLKNLDDLTPNPSRRASICVTPNRSRRGSVNNDLCRPSVVGEEEISEALARSFGTKLLVP